MMTVNLSESTVSLFDIINTYPNPQDLPSEKRAGIYQDFIDVVIEHNHRYYIDASPIISDFEYDQLFAYLKRIEESFPYLISSQSPTQGLVGQLSEGFLKADHKVPLLSLENSYNAQDLISRDQRARKILEKAEFVGEVLYMLEPKFDGLSVELVYKEGKLVQAITRGDGQTGEDITLNVKTIKNIPLQLASSDNFRVRGEVMMPKSQLQMLNQQRQSEGLNIFANTRNAASGSIKLLNSTEVAKRGLVCFVYDLLEAEKEIDLEALKLPVFKLPVKHQQHSSIEKVIASCEDIELKHFLDQQDYDFDGLVIKLSTKMQTKEENQNLALFSSDEERGFEDVRQVLGSTDHHPRRAIAYKYPTQQVASKILSIDFQVGRTGIITPVANLQPVALSGVSISRVSLHNFDFIQEKQIKNGDFVWIQRSGEVIPYVLGVIAQRRDGSEDFITPPLLCPSCQSPISNIQMHYYCTNPSCPAQLKEKILYFVSRDAMDITGFGEVVVQVLIDQNILKSLADLYALLEIENQVLLRKLPNFGEKKVSELIVQLQHSKNQPLWRVLNALGIPNIGKKTAQDLARFLSEKKVKNLDQLLEILQQTDQISAIYGIGEKVAESIRLFCLGERNLDLLRRLEAYGVNFASGDVLQDQKEGKHFSITGVFPIARSEIIRQLVERGYVFDEQPLQTTSFMLVGEKAGSKAEKAKKYQLKIYNTREEICQIFTLSKEAPTQMNKKQVIQSGLF